jgi:hypothetical protein
MEESKYPVTFQTILPCFSFYNDIDSLGVRDIQIKKDFKYTIVHPYGTYIPPKPVEDMYKCEVTLKLCNLLKGVPYGPAYIEYTHPYKKHLSFNGVGVFTEGRLHLGPFTAIDGEEKGYSIS